MPRPLDCSRPNVAADEKLETLHVHGLRKAVAPAAKASRSSSRPARRDRSHGGLAQARDLPNRPDDREEKNPAQASSPYRLNAPRKREGLDREDPNCGCYTGGSSTQARPLSVDV